MLEGNRQINHGIVCMNMLSLAQTEVHITSFLSVCIFQMITPTVMWFNISLLQLYITHTYRFKISPQRKHTSLCKSCAPTFSL